MNRALGVMLPCIDRCNKPANEADEITHCEAKQKQLGHTSIKMAEHYVRNRRGDKVEPTK
ncbi:hypothetical protein KMZ15_08990 [Mycoavidus sp. HKI]|uniref:hypothetical protein n=1 Tax=Mycoavidus sp. HKI TaxID=2840467 RepID=UPI001CBEB42E|nr:hypothetical protein [Mycoavidus sp. HKI]UTU47248.1 hypothetical protein KMZ15_08990 [Mycoavidus sp. HKI]